MSSRHLWSNLLGRRIECDAFDQVLDSVRAGQSRVLVVRGEAGVGKSTLLSYLVAQATGFRIARAAGVESEMELAFAGLHQLCAPVLDRRTRLPGPQRDALATVFGLSDGPPPDRFVVSLATLGLLADVAEERPLLCVIDDAQWQDQATLQTLAFVARRLLAEPIGLVFVVREPSAVREMHGLPTLQVGGLSNAAAHALLRRVIPGRLDVPVRDRIVAETRGNPLALLELPRGLSPAELAGGFGLPDAFEPPDMAALSHRIADHFVQQLNSLPDEAQRLLLLAAADPTGDVSLLWRAAWRLGLGGEAAAAAQATGLIDLGALVRFRHPLVRSAVYRSATQADCRLAHMALAEATDGQADPDRQAWHRAHAAAGPDEAVAAELERSAGRALARGGMAAAAAFRERSVYLTPDPVRRAERALDAAQAKYQAGAMEPAVALLAVAAAGPPDILRHARIELLHAQIAFAQRRGGAAPALLLDAAKRLEPLDARLARDSYRNALDAAAAAGRLGSGGGSAAVARAARSAPYAPGPPRATDLLLDGIAMLHIDGYAAAKALIERALNAFRQDEHRDENTIGNLLWLAWVHKAVTWDDVTACEMADRAISHARDTGALIELTAALESRAGVHVHAGEFAAAAALLEEAAAITAASGYAPLSHIAIMIPAWRGDEVQAVPLIDARIQDALATGEGRMIGVAGLASAVLYNGLARYDSALAAAQKACEYEDDGVVNWTRIELVEAGVRSGAVDAATAAMSRLEDRVSAVGSNWALGIRARSLALLSSGQAADALYREAIDRLAQTRITVHRARAHLIYGEWLRREQRRLEARVQLHTAHDLLSRMGAAAFAERARRELVATGESVRRRTSAAPSLLTPQEAQVARLARAGLSNPEIGAQLFISPRTAQYHLAKVFAKLEITSRHQLARLPESHLAST